MISCQPLTHLTILLGYTVKGYVIKPVGVYIMKTFRTLFALFSTLFTFKQYASSLTMTCFCCEECCATIRLFR